MISKLEIPPFLDAYRLITPFHAPDFLLGLSRDGNAWGVCLGYNLQDGYAGFGDTIPQALRDLADRLERKELEKQI